MYSIKAVIILLGGLLISSCTTTFEHGSPKVEWPLIIESTPTGEIDHSKLSETCPNFSGIYKSRIHSTETTYVTQIKCEKITVTQEIPGYTQRNTYYLDGSSITLRKYQMHSVPFIAFFKNDKLLFEGQGDNYTKYEEWELKSNESEKLRQLSINLFIGRL